MKFVDLVEFLCEEWKNLEPHTISLSYSLLGNSKCLLDNEVDFHNIQSIVSSFCLDRVDVFVMNNSVDCVDECGSENHASGSMLSDNNRQVESTHQDSFSKYHSHQERVLIGAIWASGIGEVGQVFK